MDVVKDELKSEIDGKKYLLVLDDVWNESPVEWMKLEDLLMGGATGSKVLITTRSELVARTAKSTATHTLKGLSHDESWSLFKQVAFRRGMEPENPTIAEIGKEVVGKCVGVLLAIKTIGGTLGLTEEVNDWLDFKTNDLPRITQDSDGEIVSILKLSYDYLSAPLKRCFVYCAVFPKDHNIKKEELIRMWMAQGFIQLDGTTRSLEDVGEQHLKDLLHRSFFEAYTDGYCKMHDLIHDLAQSVGGDEYYSHGMDLNCINEATRHAWIPLRISTNLFRAKKLRTLIITPWGEEKCNENMRIPKHTRVLILRRTEMMRVPRRVDGLTHLNYLDLSFNGFDLLPDSICSLYKLQTMILSFCEMLIQFPREMRNLVSLRYLNIVGCVKLSDMPRGLEELTCLWTLTDFVMGPEDRNCSQLGDLKSLVNLRGHLTLRNLDGSKLVNYTRGQTFYPDFLTKMMLINSLGLVWIDKHGVEEEEAELILFESLKPHSNLQELAIIKYGGKRFPSWLDSVNIGLSLPNIIGIKIYCSKSCPHLPPFGLLPSLRRLSLGFMDNIEYIYKEEDYQWDHNNASTKGGGSCSSKAPQVLFPSLERLAFYTMPKLRKLVEPTTISRLNRLHFPVLEQLRISGCPMFAADGSDEENQKQFLSLTTLRKVEFSFSPNLETLPDWLQDLPNLQTLKLSMCGNIVTLPEWMGNLTSLQKICLGSCQSLASIPNCMRNLTSLQRLEVKDCPKLLTRCEKETGEDWHNIAHIPNLLFNMWYYFFSIYKKNVNVQFNPNF